MARGGVISQTERLIGSHDKAVAIAQAAHAKQANDIVTMDMRSVSSVTDFFIVASGTSSTHLRAVAEEIDTQLARRGVQLWHREGLEEAIWVLLDYGDVVAHLFYPSARRFYDLERLWGDAPRVDLLAAASPKR